MPFRRLLTPVSASRAAEMPLPFLFFDAAISSLRARRRRQTFSPTPAAITFFAHFAPPH
jgi:hypothetical protein